MALPLTFLMDLIVDLAAVLAVRMAIVCCETHDFMGVLLRKG